MPLQTITTLEKKHILMIKLLLSVSLVKTVDSSFVDEHGGRSQKWPARELIRSSRQLPSLSFPNMGHKAGQWSGDVVSEDLQ